MVIKWEPWADPLNALLTNHEETDGYGGGTVTEDGPKPFGRSGPVLIGPMGLIPLTEGNLPSKLYRFWMGHTDFRITHQVAADICGVDGVESLDVFSPYRFRLAVGKAFSEDEVKAEISSLFTPPKMLDGMDAVEELASGLHEHWAAYKDEQGVMSLVVGDSEKEVRKAGKEKMVGAKEARFSW